MYIFILDSRSYQQICERAAKLDVNAVFASLSALSFPVMPTCKGIHAVIINLFRFVVVSFLGGCRNA